MRTLYFLLIIGASALIVSCTDLHGGDKPLATDTMQMIVPEMVPRTSTIGLPGEYEKLQANYSKLKEELKKHPGDLKNMLKLSEVFISESRITGNYGPNEEAALTLLNSVLVRSKGNGAGMKDIRGQALTLKAVIKLSQHQFVEALALGEEAVKLDPYKAFNYGVLVDANVELGEYAKAVVMSDKMVNTRPDLQSYGRISYLREIHGDIPGAIEAMGMAITAGYPGSEETSWCLVQSGGLSERSGDLKTAEKQYSRAITERPGYPFALAALGRINGKNKEYAQAEKNLKAAINAMPNAHFYQDLARVHKAQGNTTGYDACVKTAEELLIGLSGAQQDHGDHKSAHDHALNAHGHSHQIGLEMARYELEFHHDLPTALANAEHEFEHREKNIEVNAVLAAILMEQGDLGASSAHLEMAKATGSTSAELMLLDGLLQCRKGDTKKGKVLIAKALELDPYLQHPLREKALAI